MADKTPDTIEEFTVPEEELSYYLEDNEPVESFEVPEQQAADYGVTKRFPLAGKENQPLQDIKAFGVGAASGGSLGTVDEAQAAARAFVDYLTSEPEIGQTSPETAQIIPKSALEKYKQYRDEYRQMEKQMSEQSPVAHTLGSVAGGIAVPSVLSKGSVVQKMRGMGPNMQTLATKGLLPTAVKTAEAGAKGGAFGAIAAFGYSDADLVEAQQNPEKMNEIVDRLKNEMASGGKWGALAGIALSGIAGMGNMIKKKLASSKTGQKYIEGQEYGKAGIDVRDKSFREAVSDEAYGYGEEVNKLLRELQRKYGRMVKQVVPAKGKKIDIGRQLDRYRKYLSKTRSNDPAVRREIDKIRNVLDDFEYGKTTKRFKQVPKTTDEQKLIDDFKKRQIEEYVRNRRDVSPDDIDVSFEPVIDETGAETGQLYGTIRRLRRNPKTGNVIINKETGTPVYDVLGRARKFDPNELQEVRNVIERVREGGKGRVVSPRELLQLKQDISKYTALGDRALKDAEAVNRAITITKNLGQKLTREIPGLRTANEGYNTIMNVARMLKVDKNPDFQGVMSKIGSKILAKNIDAYSGDKARRIINEALKELTKKEPEIAAQIGARIEDIATKADLATATGANFGVAFTSTGTPVVRTGGQLEAVGARMGASSGLHRRALKETVEGVGDIARNTLQGIRKLTPQNLQAASAKLRSQAAVSPASKAHERLANILDKAANSNYKVRNILMYSAMDDKWMRDLVKEDPELLNLFKGLFVSGEDEQ